MTDATVPANLQRLVVLHNSTAHVAHRPLDAAALGASATAPPGG